MKMSTIRCVSMMLLLVSIVPIILILVSTSWFLYQGGLPDMVSITVATHRTFWMTLISLGAILANSVIMLYLSDFYKNKRGNICQQ